MPLQPGENRSFLDCIARDVTSAAMGVDVKENERRYRRC
jgi:hypothetical protein